MSFSQIKTGILILLLFYLLVGFFHGRILKKENDPLIFPFFSWKIFDRVARTTEEYATLRIIEYDSKRPESPLYFNDAIDLFDTKFTSPQIWYDMFEDLCENLKLKNTKNIKLLREKIESSMLPRDVIYEVAVIRMNPTEFYKSRSILNSVSCGILKKGEAFE